MKFRRYGPGEVIGGWQIGRMVRDGKQPNDVRYEVRRLDSDHLIDGIWRAPTVMAHNKLLREAGL